MGFNYISTGILITLGLMITSCSRGITESEQDAHTTNLPKSDAPKYLYLPTNLSNLSLTPKLIREHNQNNTQSPEKPKAATAQLL